jgi:enoyl-CoA hydratase
VSFEHLRVEHDGEVAVVHVDRAPVNAMDQRLLAEGAAMLDELAADPPAAVVVAGRPGCFSAGVDLKLAPTLDAAGQRELVDGINRLFAGWYSLERPLVAAMTGHAIAGGLILALCGDVRVCSRDGQFGLTEVRAGIPYPAVAIAVVRAELRPELARELVLGGELVRAERLLEGGAVDELAEPDGVLPRALERARELAAIPPGAYATVKRQLRRPALEEIARALEGEGDPLAQGWIGDEAAGAARSLLEGG